MQRFILYFANEEEFESFRQGVTLALSIPPNAVRNRAVDWEDEDDCFEAHFELADVWAQRMLDSYHGWRACRRWLKT